MLSQRLDQALPIREQARARLTRRPAADLDVKQPQGLGLGDERFTEQAGQDRFLDVRALELRVPVMDHVEPAAPQGPAVRRREHRP